MASKTGLQGTTQVAYTNAGIGDNIMPQLLTGGVGQRGSSLTAIPW